MPYINPYTQPELHKEGSRKVMERLRSIVESGKTYRFEYENDEYDGEIETVAGIPIELIGDTLVVKVTDRCSFKVGAKVDIDVMSFQCSDIYLKEDDDWKLIKKFG